MLFGHFQFVDQADLCAKTDDGDTYRREEPVTISQCRIPELSSR